MYIVTNNHELKVFGGNIEMYFYIKYSANSNVLKRVSGNINGIDLHVSDLNMTYKKSGKGRIKNENEVFMKIEQVENLLKEKGYTFSS